MRILIWSPRGSGEHYGGPGMSIYRTYSVAASGDNSFLLIHGNPSQSEYALFSRNVMAYPAMTKNFSPYSQARFVLNGIHWMKQNRKEFDVFFGLMAYHHTVLPASFVRRRLGKPAFVRVATAHSDLGSKGGLKKWMGLAGMRRKMLRSLDGVISISDEITTELRSYGLPEHLIHQIPNGVDTDRFYSGQANDKALNRALLGIGNRFTLIFTGNLVRKKQPHLVVEAVAACVKSGMDIQLLVIGPEHEAEYAAEMRYCVSEKGISDRVKFIGFVANPEQYYRAADVFILPSLREGMSNSMLEAASCGIPVIMGPVSGAKDLVGTDKPGGRIIEVESQTAILEAIQDYFKNPDLCRIHGANARAMVVSKFSAKRVFHAHMELFRCASEKRTHK